MRLFPARVLNSGKDQEGSTKNGNDKQYQYFDFFHKTPHITPSLSGKWQRSKSHMVKMKTDNQMKDYTPALQADSTYHVFNHAVIPN